MKRGEIWWAALRNPNGSGPGFRRPVLVVQSNGFNNSEIATVVVAVITSNLSRAAAPGNVRVSGRESGLPRPSVVNVGQIVTLDKKRLATKAGSLPGKLMRRVDEGLRLMLSLGPA